VLALLAQLAPVPDDPAANVETIMRVLDEHPAADLAVFPELFISGYDPPAAARLAIEAADPALAPIAAAARRNETAVIVGFTEITAGRTANSVACFGPDGELLPCYRKTHLFGAEEQRMFEAGDELVVVDLGVGRLVGLLVCFDVEFPEPARALARAGAGLLVTVAANMEPFGPDHELAVSARALDNRLPHIYVNRVGEQSGHTFAGGSAVTDSAGRVVSSLGNRPAVQLVEVDLDYEVPAHFDYLSQARPELPVRVSALAKIEGGKDEYQGT
jgi:predicted amidohydrolase